MSPVPEAMAAIGSSSLAELVWTGPDGRPEVRGAVAMRLGERPGIAFTYADEAVARAVAAAPVAVLAMTETRSTGPAFTPVQMRGRPCLVEDPDGEVFAAQLLDQELRRFPPARVYADSPLLRREHWWFLPRLIVELEVDSEKGAVQHVDARTDPRDHLLVVAGDRDRVDVHVARVPPTWPATPAATPLPLTVEDPPAPGPAVLFGQDASFPDLERWSQWRWRGHWDGTALQVEERPSRPGLQPAPGLWERWRRQRDLEKRCRRAIGRR